MRYWDWLESWFNQTSDWPANNDSSPLHESPAINPASGLSMQDDNIFGVDTDGNRYGFYDDRFTGDHDLTNDVFNSFHTPWDTHD